MEGQREESKQEGNGEDFQLWKQIDAHGHNRHGRNPATTSATRRTD